MHARGGFTVPPPLDPPTLLPSKTSQQLQRPHPTRHENDDIGEDELLLASSSPPFQQTLGSEILDDTLTFRATTDRERAHREHGDYGVITTGGELNRAGARGNTRRRGATFASVSSRPTAVGDSLQNNIIHVDENQLLTHVSFKLANGTNNGGMRQPTPPSFGGNNSTPNYALGARGALSSNAMPFPAGPNSANMSGSGGGSNDAHALKNKISELEFELSSTKREVEVLRQTADAFDDVRLERDVMKRNCDILMSNVETLKAFSTEIATQLDQSTTRCQTLEEKLECSSLKKELHEFEGADAMRKLYEGRLASLERALKASVEANEKAVREFAERELTQDERIKNLENSKDEVILRLIKENERLRAALSAGKRQQDGPVVTNSNFQSEKKKVMAGHSALNAHVAHRENTSISDRQLLAQLRADRRELRSVKLIAAPANYQVKARVTGGGDVDARPSTRRLVEPILKLTVESKDLVSLDEAKYPPSLGRRLQLLQGAFPPPPQHNEPKYHVDLQVDSECLSLVEEATFMKLKQLKNYGADVSEGNLTGGLLGYGAPLDTKKEWHFVTDMRKGIKVSIETV